jgi:Ca-activated chloride channel family protein
MKLSPDDPKLTDYVLGELNKAATDDIKRELENSVECRAEVSELKSFSVLLKEEFQKESALKLSPEQKEIILMKTESSDNKPVSDGEKIVPFPFSKWLLYGGLTAAAACIMAGLFLPALSKAKFKSQRISRLQRSSYDPYFQTASSSAQPLPSTQTYKYARRTYDKGGYFGENKNWTKNETARYPKYAENDFKSVSQEPLSTFSIDVDTASYANVRRFLNEDRLPPSDAVRIEELINYFSYNYPQPKGDEPFSANLEVAGCPWNSQHRLVRIGLKGKEIAQDKRPPSNFVFLIDVSGSMSPSERLPLIKQALRMLVKRMTENDRIAIVVYASSSGVVLESTSCANKEKILAALDRLEAGGSTNGGEGVQRAYALAEENFIKGGVNRVILCTDGDFNVGITDQSELINLIQRKAKSGVFLSALGVGTDNYKDALMQKLADKGNGNYHYIDTMEEAQKVLIQQMNGTLVTIAKDVKIQIEFNPAQVSSYRLIGYEKRILAAEDFNNDKKDAGEIGAGHTVTALYEIVPANSEENGARGKVDDLKYQKPTPKPKRESNNDNRELLTLKLRYKKPDGKTSRLMETALTDSGEKFSQASSDFRFASAVAGFGMILKNSEHKGDWTFKSVLDVAEHSKGDDKEGYRAEFINLVKKAKALERVNK